MANWAIVIGVDKYWRPEVSLRAAVRDALDMRSWLLDPAGGNVPEQNLTLLLAPDQTAPTGVNYLPADFDTIVNSIERMLARSGGTGERVFFHFSGHGLSQRVNFSTHSAIVTSDFTDILTNHSLTVASLFELFQGTQFAEQYFFIDACRNLAFDTEKVLGEYPNPRPPVAPVSPQFVMFATQPLVKAVEIRQPGNEHGAFTRTLRDGFRGAASAKRWDEERGEYVVRWSSLFRHVEAAVEAMKLGLPSDGPLVQAPRQYGERGSLDPILGTFTEAMFTQEQLQIDLDPPKVEDNARVTVGEMMRITSEYGPPVRAPLTMNLPPRTYAIEARAPGYRMRQRVVRVDLYQPERARVELVPEQPPKQPGVIGPEPPKPGGPETPATGRIAISSNDRLAQLELAHASGRLIQVGRGSISVTGQPPGFYRARLVSPEGVATEQLFELAIGDDTRRVVLDAPTPTSGAMQWAMRTGGFLIHNDGTVEPSESIGGAAFLKLSTVLALAAGASMEGQRGGHGHKLRNLLIPAFQMQVPFGTTNGLMVVFGEERGDTALAPPIELQFQDLGQHHGLATAPLQPLPNTPAVAHAAFSLESGSYWFALKQLNEGEGVSMPVVVLPGHVTLIVLTREVDQTLELHQYQPVLDPATSATAAVPDEWKMRDPDFSLTRFAAFRRIELMQRNVMHGRVTPSMPDIDNLLMDKWADPIAGCLGGYLLLRMGQVADLRVPATNLVKYFPELPDAHVLYAAYLEQAVAPGDGQKVYLEALEHGVPLYRDGLVLLHAAIQRHGLIHPRARLIAELVNSVPAGSLWSLRPSAELMVLT